MSIEDFFSAKYSVKEWNSIEWQPQSQAFSYIYNNTLFIQNADSLHADTLLSVFQFSNNIHQLVTRLPSYHWVNNKTIVFETDSSLIIYNTSLHSITKTINLLPNADNIDYHNSLAVAFTVNNNLWIIDSVGNKLQLSNNLPGICSGCEYVYREEFETSKATFWSPSGNSLAYYTLNEQEINDYYRLEYLPNQVRQSNLKYPFAGTKNQIVSISVYNIKSKKSIRLATGDIDSYLTNITWSPDEQSIYIQVLSRDQKTMSLKQYSAKNGSLMATLFTETNPKYVEPQYPLYFIDNGNNFLYLSNRNGFNQLYLYKADSGILKQLTKQHFTIDKILGIDSHNSTIYYTAIPDSNPLSTHIYSTNFKTFTTTCLSSPNGIHDGIFNTENAMIIDRFSNLQTPSKISLISHNKVSHTLYEATNPFANYTMPVSKFVTITAADSCTSLYGGLILPPQFDSTKKYPVILYVYGGPHVQLVTNNWLINNGFFLQYLASKGFVIFMLDSRGSANRGFEFESCTHLQLGTIEAEDQLKGISWLTKQPFIDSSKIGVYGVSFGGFMTLSLIEKAPLLFKVAVSASPVTDWKYYEIMYGERYMSTPQNNIKGYTLSSTINKVRNIKAKLLLINGGLDHITVLQNSMTFVNECIKNNVQIDYFLYPNHDHHVIGKDRIHYFYKVSNYFIDNLK